MKGDVHGEIEGRLVRPLPISRLPGSVDPRPGADGSRGVTDGRLRFTAGARRYQKAKDGNEESHRHALSRQLTPRSKGHREFHRLGPVLGPIDGNVVT